MDIISLLFPESIVERIRSKFLIPHSVRKIPHFSILRISRYTLIEFVAITRQIADNLDPLRRKMVRTLKHASPGDHPAKLRD